MNLPVYEDMYLFIEKDMKITWKEIKDIFQSTFKEDRQVYVNIYKSGLYRVACRNLAFSCMDIIHWVASHTDHKMMILRNTSGTQLASFRKENYYHIYHFPQPVNYMDALFLTPNNNLNIIYIKKCWVKEPSNFRMTPNQVSKMKSLKKAYQLLFIFACHLYGYESMETSHRVGLLC